MTPLTSNNYHRLRGQSDGLRRASASFEGKRWQHHGDMLTRRADDGSELRLYRIEGAVEVCIILKDGTSATFS